MTQSATDILTKALDARDKCLVALIPHHDDIHERGLYLKVARADGYELEENPSVKAFHCEITRFRLDLRRLGVEPSQLRLLTNSLLGFSAVEEHTWRPECVASNINNRKKVFKQ